MIDKELLTIPVFAELAGKKKQGIYEQIKNEKSQLAPYVVFQGEKAFLKREALKEVYGIDNDISQDSKAENQESKIESQEESQENQGNSQGDSQENQVKSQDKQEPFTEHSIIAFYQKQIEEKDRQLAEKDKQIERITQLLDQEQKLHLGTKMLLLEYKKQEEEPQEESNPAPQEENKEEEQKPKKKRSWWRWILLGED